MIGDIVNDMINNVWPVIVIFTVVVTLVRIFYLKNHSRKLVIYHEIFSLCFIIYLLLLFELVTNQDMHGISSNYTPFKEMFRYKITSPLFLRNVLGNVLLFVPFGYFISVYIKPKRLFSPFFITIVTSLTIEFVQMKIGRVFDVDDIILNVVGGILGYYLYVGLMAIKKKLPSFFQKEAVYNIFFLIILAILVLYFLKTSGIWWF